MLALLGGWIIATAGCGGMGAASGIYRAELGQAPSRSLLTEIIRSELQSFGYELRGTGGSSFRTGWRSRQVESSGAVNITQRRDQAYISLSKRAEGYYRAQMRITYEVYRDGQWQPAEPPPRITDEFDDLRTSIRDRLQQYMTQN